MSDLHEKIKAWRRIPWAELWEIAEVYENILFDGSRHMCIISFPGMAERTVRVSRARTCAEDCFGRRGANYEVSRFALSAGLKMQYRVTEGSYPNCLEMRRACSRTRLPTLARSSFDMRNSGPDSQIDAMGYSL